jgi:hypothetical protein
VKKLLWTRSNTELEEGFTDGSSSTRRLFKKAVQQGRSEGRGEAYFVPYVEPLSDARTPLADFFNSLLNGFLNFAATQAACADPNAFWLTVNQCPDWLEVRLEDPLGLVIGVTDVMAGLATFAAEIACKCHGYTPSSSRIDARLRSSKCIIGPFVLTSRFDGLGQLTHIIHDGLSRNRTVATRDRRAESREREAYLKQYVDRPNGEPACLDAVPTAFRCVAPALARSSALCMIVARRENTALDSDFRLRDCSRNVHELCERGMGASGLRKGDIR